MSNISSQPSPQQNWGETYKFALELLGKYLSSSELNGPRNRETMLYVALLRHSMVLEYYGVLKKSETRHPSLQENATLQAESPSQKAFLRAVNSIDFSSPHVQLPSYAGLPLEKEQAKRFVQRVCLYHMNHTSVHAEMLNAIDSEEVQHRYRIASAWSPEPDPSKDAVLYSHQANTRLPPTGLARFIEDVLDNDASGKAGSWKKVASKLACVPGTLEEKAYQSFAFDDGIYKQSQGALQKAIYLRYSSAVKVLQQDPPITNKNHVAHYILFSAEESLWFDARDQILRKSRALEGVIQGNAVVTLASDASIPDYLVDTLGLKDAFESVGMAEYLKRLRGKYEDRILGPSVTAFDRDLYISLMFPATRRAGMEGMTPQVFESFLRGTLELATPETRDELGARAVVVEALFGNFLPWWAYRESKIPFGAVERPEFGQSSYLVLHAAGLIGDGEFNEIVLSRKGTKREPYATDINLFLQGIAKVTEFRDALEKLNVEGPPAAKKGLEQINLVIENAARTIQLAESVPNRQVEAIQSEKKKDLPNFHDRFLRLNGSVVTAAGVNSLFIYSPEEGAIVLIPIDGRHVPPFHSPAFLNCDRAKEFSPHSPDTTLILEKMIENQELTEAVNNYFDNFTLAIRDSYAEFLPMLSFFNEIVKDGNMFAFDVMNFYEVTHVAPLIIPSVDVEKLKSFWDILGTHGILKIWVNSSREKRNWHHLLTHFFSEEDFFEEFTPDIKEKISFAATGIRMAEKLHRSGQGTLIDVIWTARVFEEAGIDASTERVSLFTGLPAMYVLSLEKKAIDGGFLLEEGEVSKRYISTEATKFLWNTGNLIRPLTRPVKFFNASEIADSQVRNALESNQVLYWMAAQIKGEGRMLPSQLKENWMSAHRDGLFRQFVAERKEHLKFFNEAISQAHTLGIVENDESGFIVVNQEIKNLHLRSHSFSARGDIFDVNERDKNRQRAIEYAKNLFGERSNLPHYLQ